MKQRGSAASEKYAKLNEIDVYKEINKSLIDFTANINPTVIADVGCGAGSLTLMATNQWPNSDIICCDPDDNMLQMVKILGAKVSKYINCTAEKLDNHQDFDTIDIVYMANSIHLVSDIGLCFQAISNILRPEGLFAFNTAFYAGSHTANSFSILTTIMKRAKKIVADRGLAAIQVHDGKPLAKRALTQGLYRDFAAKAGFAPVNIEIRSFDLPINILSEIVSNPMFARGALPDIDENAACEVLIDAIEQVFHELGLEKMQHRWMYMVFKKGAQNDGGR